jgi:hypothetical protein
MKNLLTLIILLLPFLAKAQTPYCGPYTTSAPIVVPSGTNGRLITGISTTSIVVQSGCSNIHITKCLVGNSNTGTANAIDLESCTNCTVDSCVITMVNQGILARHCVSEKINGNYCLNILGSPTLTLHPIQIQNCTGGSQQIIGNKIQEDPTISPYTHDQISVYQSNGLVGDSIMVLNNWIRGGQQVQNGTGPGGGTGSTNGAAGIGVGDSGGSYQVIRGNLLVNALAIAIDGTGTSLKVDHNKSYAVQVYPQPNSVGIVYFGAAGNNFVGYNQLNFRQSNGNVFNINPASTSVAGWSTNTPNSTTNPLANAGMIPTPMVSPCTVVRPPVITYSGTPFTFTVGTTIGTATPINTGGTPIVYTISPNLPIGLNFSTATGVISGTPTSVSPLTVYTITATNSAGSGNTTINITVNPAPVALPAFTYSPAVNVYTIPKTVSLTPISTGGAIVSFTVSPALPTGLSLNSSTGVISGTVSAISPQTTYTIVGTNASGTGRATMQITVNANPIVIPNISYSPATMSMIYGVTIPLWVPTNTGSAATYSVSPALPLGLNLNASNGQISGFPVVVQSSQNYVVIATNASGSANYTISISVGQHPLTVTALGQQVYFNQPIPTLTFSVTGLISGDLVSTIFSTPPSLSTSATQGSPIGSYEIIPDGAVSPNYSISYQNGTLLITAPNNSIHFRVFGGIKNF